MTKLSIALTNEGLDNFLPTLRIPVGVFVGLIPDDTPHEQGQRGKAGRLLIPADHIQAFVNQLRPHITDGLPPCGPAHYPLRLCLEASHITPAHIYVDVYIEGYNAGILTLRNTRLEPFLRHSISMGFDPGACSWESIIEYTGVRPPHE